MAIISEVVKQMEIDMERAARDLTEHPMVAPSKYSELQAAVSMLSQRLEDLMPAKDSNPSQRIKFAELRTEAIKKLREIWQGEITDMGDTMLGEEG